VTERPTVAARAFLWEFCRMEEMTCVRSHACFHDNDGWRVTAVDLLSANNLEGIHCVYCSRLSVKL